jgi:hypothetical protein
MWRRVVSYTGTNVSEEISDSIYWLEEDEDKDIRFLCNSSVIHFRIERDKITVQLKIYCQLLLSYYDYE